MTGYMDLGRCKDCGDSIYRGRHLDLDDMTAMYRAHLLACTGRDKLAGR